jgi:esterase/lipase superfamily enzyme
MNECYLKWYTPWLSREFEMLVFGNGGGPPLIPASHAAVLFVRLMIFLCR